MCTIDNDIYNQLGDRWYTAYNDPVALLRAESRLTNTWIIDVLRKQFDYDKTIKILDVGCGAGFHTNKLVMEGYENVNGLDISQQSLNVAEKYDITNKVNYICGDAYHLPFEDNSLDAVISMDFLEHVEEPEKVVAEIGRVLKDHGVFVFHTFNRNLLSWLVIIKCVEWFVPNTPKDMHALDLFIKPKELEDFMKPQGLDMVELKGTMVDFKFKHLKGIFKREVPSDLSFKFTKNTNLSYIGFSKKTNHAIT